MHLKLQNLKSINEYISVLFKINSQLKLCEENVTKEDMLKKENIQYISCLECAPAVAISRAYKFKKYYELIYCLLVAK